MGLNVAIEADFDDLEALWKTAPDITREELTAAVTEATMLLEGQVKEATPGSVGGSGGLKGSIRASEPQVLADNVIGVVGTSKAHAVPVELGTRPHIPPIQPLIDWVTSSDNGRALLASVRSDDPNATPERVAHMLKWTIARRGTKGRFMFRDTFERYTPTVLRMLEQANVRILERMAP